MQSSHSSLYMSSSSNPPPPIVHDNTTTSNTTATNDSISTSLAPTTSSSSSSSSTTITPNIPAYTSQSKRKECPLDTQNASMKRRKSTCVPAAIALNDAQFRVAFNDGSVNNLQSLIGFKSVISEQLPNMPKEYIVRVVLDRNHRSIVIVQNDSVIGGICFRPFHSQGFAEIVFLAITETEKHKGFGTRVMNHLKEHVKSDDIKFFLTYADNTAIGYFVKQGFTKRKQMPKNRWEGFIKDYVRSTLMECKIMYNISYLNVRAIIQRQREAVQDKVKQISSSHIVREAVPQFIRGERSIKIENIPGVIEAGFDPSRKPRRRVGPLSDLHAQLGQVLKLLRKLKDAWPFQKPVEEWEAPNYHDVIKHPMDLQTMENNLDEGMYSTKEAFLRDVNLIVENCKAYNSAETVYVKCAFSLQKRCRKLIKKVK